MASKKISELDAKTPNSADVLPVADPTTGLAGKSNCAQLFVAGASSQQIVPMAGVFGYAIGNLPISSNRNDMILGPQTIYNLIPSLTVDITGIAPAPPATSNQSGRMLWLVNTGSHTINFKNEDALSTASNRFITHTGNQVSMNSGHIALAIYDSGVARWRIWDLT